MIARTLATLAGFEPGLYAALTPVERGGLAVLGASGVLAALVHGFGARRWALDAGLGTPAALAIGVAFVWLSLAILRTWHAGGGLKVAAWDGPTEGEAVAAHRPSLAGLLWLLPYAGALTLPLAAHAAVEASWPDEAVFPRGAAAWVEAASALGAPSIAAWVSFSAIATAPAWLAQLWRSPRRAHAQCRVARDDAFVRQARRQHLRQLAAALAAHGYPTPRGFDPTLRSAPWAPSALERPWAEATPTELSRVRWLLGRDARAAAGSPSATPEGLDDTPAVSAS